MTFTIRPLEPAEWELFRDFRLGALNASPGVFAVRYEDAITNPPEFWRSTIKGPAHQVFGLFDGGKLIGITAAFSHRDDPTGQTALLAMSFILPDYRGRGLSRMFYDARLAWICAQPQFKRVVVSHRESNEASRRANQRRGFLAIEKTPHIWPNGEREDEVFYELKISSLKINAIADKARAGIADLLDRQLSPLGLRAMEALSPQTGEAILDVGCGAGKSVLQLADRVGPTGRVTGVDIAPAVLEVARRRAAGLSQVDFLECDAQRLTLPDRSIDCVFSGFGVMAFRDPVAAFSNFRRMMRPSGRLAFVSWRSLKENELDFLPLQAAGLEGWLDPTPFSFADSGYIRTMLQTAGFREITIQAHDEMVSSGDLNAMIVVLLTVGALGKIIRENPNMRTAAEPRVRAALAEQGNQAAVALNAATWVVTARP